MYVGHLLVVRRSLLDRCGGLDPAFDTIQDYELLLRLSERAERIHHIPRVLYHWRAIPGSIAADAEAKPGVPELQARAVNDHLRRLGVAAEASPHEVIPHRTRLRPLERRERPAVSVVIPSRGNAERALASVQERTSYEPLELIVEEAEGSFRPAALANRGARRSDARVHRLPRRGLRGHRARLDRAAAALRRAPRGGRGRAHADPPRRTRLGSRVRDRAVRPGRPRDARIRGRWRRLLRLALGRPGGLRDRNGVHARAPLRLRAGSGASRRPSAASSRTTTSACGCGAGASR